MQLEELRDETAGLGFELTPQQVQGLQTYLSTLEKWNRSVNLVGPSHWREILHSLVVDSLYLAKFLKRIVHPEDIRSLDLGAGAGLPGLPLRLVWEQGSYYLVESRFKRCAFMRQAIAAMGIQNTYVINGRVEELHRDILPADLIVSRAFMPWKKLLALTVSLLDDKGSLIVLSSQEAAGKDLQDFVLKEQFCYQVQGKRRFFWALQKMDDGG